MDKEWLILCRDFYVDSRERWKRFLIIDSILLPIQVFAIVAMGLQSITYFGAGRYLLAILDVVLGLANSYSFVLTLKLLNKTRERLRELSGLISDLEKQICELEETEV